MDMIRDDFIAGTFEQMKAAIQGLTHERSDDGLVAGEFHRGRRGGDWLFGSV
jgi:hypothetical protein